MPILRFPGMQIGPGDVKRPPPPRFDFDAAMERTLSEAEMCVQGALARLALYRKYAGMAKDIQAQSHQERTG